MVMEPLMHDGMFLAALDSAVRPFRRMPRSGAADPSFPSVEQLTRLANEMFKKFARIEYALKAAGFHCGDGEALPNWRAFAESQTTTFDRPPDGVSVDPKIWTDAHVRLLKRAAGVVKGAGIKAN
jgi:hypothetical protein